MTFSISESRQLSLGSVHGAIIKVDVTSYTANGEDMSKSALEIGGDPIFLQASPTEKGLAYVWDKANKKLKLKYPHGATVKHSASPNNAPVNLAASDANLEATTDGSADVSFGDEAVELSATDDGGTWELFVMWG